jgi:hypothetical protein
MYLRSGLADVLDPQAGSSLDCGFFGGGVFNEACWCLEFPSLCSADKYKAAVALANPDIVYAQPLPPPPVAAPTGAALTVPPASGEQAAQTVNDLLAQQEAAWQAQNARTMAETAGNLKNIQQPQNGGVPMWVWIGLAGIAVFGVVAIGAGSPRRYGR